MRNPYTLKKACSVMRSESVEVVNGKGMNPGTVSNVRPDPARGRDR